MNALNPEQAEAVASHNGPLLVLAGAGSGKTLVVTRRIAGIINSGVSPKAILAMTFTNKAAGEMLERVIHVAGDRGRQVTICTFHAFGLRVLGAETAALGFPDGKFAIFDQSDQASAIREILRGINDGRKYDVWAILTRISKAKNDFVNPKNYEVRNGDEYDEITEIVYPRYIRALRAFRAFDFDDLVCEVVNLFKKRPDVLARWRDRYWYLMVDEYQDTNHAQFELVRLLSNERGNVCVVGDDDQSIYAWRGADVSNILDFERHYPGTKVVKLLRNYRSSEAILAVANAVISSSSARRHDKQLLATRASGEKVRLIVADSPEIEASFIADQTRRLIDEKGIRPGDVAVLYRSNSQAEAVETALRQREIPYRVVGGTQFYEKKEVKDLIAYLRVALNPTDEISLRRIINYPTRGIGDIALERLATHALAHNMSLWRAVENASTVKALPSSALAGCNALVAIILDATRKLAARDPSALVAQGICDAAGIDADIIAGSGSNTIAARRRDNLKAIIRVFDRHDKAPDRGPDSLAGLLRILSLSTSDDAVDPGNVMTLTTMHGAKGLEFKTVFIAGTEEGLIPHARTLDTRTTDVDPQSIDEERRLFYVAVTRAMDRLFICRCAERSMRGKPMPRTPSRFLKDVPADLMERHDIHEISIPSTQSQLQNVEALLAALKG